MKLRLFLDAVARSFWFVPALVALCFVIAAAVATWIDANTQLYGLARALDVSPAAARSVLSALAGGMMTVASIVFSLTFVALTTLSSQFGPRLLTFFMSDRPTRIVLGAFFGVFLFALIALLRVQDTEATPLVALLAAIVLACGALGMMIYFIHHIAQSIQADVIVARLGAQLSAAAQKVVRRRRREGGADAARPEWTDATQEGAAIVAPAGGYVQMVDAAALVAAAQALDVQIDCLARAGDFVLAGEPIARISAASVAQEAQDRIAAAVMIGERRTPAQEIAFEMTALTEVAVRALSPGVNDPNTAAACVHRLAEGLATLSALDLDGDFIHCDEEGAPRARLRGRNFRELLETAFAQIRRYARDDANVFGALIDAHEALGRVVVRQSHRDALGGSLDIVEEHVGAFFTADCDRRTLCDAVERARAALEDPQAGRA